MVDHIVASYDEELTQLDTLIMTMGSAAAEMTENAVTALCNRDHDLAREVIKTDKQVNSALIEITEHAQNILALRSPLANDLRAVISAIQIGLNLERVGDLAKNISKILLKNDITLNDPIRAEIEKMSKKAHSSLRDVLVAYSQGNTEAALAIHQNDKQLDVLHKALTKMIMLDIKSVPDDIDSDVQLLFVSRHLERIGDHAQNIAEAVIYRVDGVIYEPED